MSKQEIKTIIEARTQSDGLSETGIKGVQFFRATSAIPCAPAVYEPSIIAIVSGAKETVLDGARYVYNNEHYLCCPTSMPVTAGTPSSSTENPLFGVYISLDQRVMTELAVEMENAGSGSRNANGGAVSQGIRLARWDDGFTDALSRLVALEGADVSVLGQSRLRELYYAILKGEAGYFMRQSFGVGNAISRSIGHVSSCLNEQVSIEGMAAKAGMSRAVFHRKFKQATTMSPIQFVKSMRLNSAAMKISEGASVNEAALSVGYVSPSQFSREFRRMFGQSPRQWSDDQKHALGMV